MPTLEMLMRLWWTFCLVVCECTVFVWRVNVLCVRVMRRKKVSENLRKRETVCVEAADPFVPDQS